MGNCYFVSQSIEVEVEFKNGEWDYMYTVIYWYVNVFDSLHNSE